MNDRVQLENKVDTRIQQNLHDNRPGKRTGIVARDNVPHLKQGQCEAVREAEALMAIKPAEVKPAKDDISRLGHIDH